MPLLVSVVLDNFAELVNTVLEPLEVRLGVDARLVEMSQYLLRSVSDVYPK